jgi:hypothetical protein
VLAERVIYQIDFWIKQYKIDKTGGSKEGPNHFIFLPNE